MTESKVKLNIILMKMKKSEKAGLKLNIQKTKIMASGPITTWQVYGETETTVKDSIFRLQNHLEDDCSHKIKTHLLLGRKPMTNRDIILKSRGITLLTNVRIVKAMFF